MTTESRVGTSGDGDYSLPGMLVRFQECKNKQQFETEQREWYNEIMANLEGTPTLDVSPYEENPSLEDTTESFIPYADFSHVEIDTEIEISINSISMSCKDVESTLRMVIDDLKFTFGSHGFLESKFKVYGSYSNGLCCIDSDIDIYCECVEHNSGNIPECLSEHVWKIFEFDSNFSRAEFVEDAIVPLVGVLHVKTGKQCYLSFSDQMTMKNSSLMKFYVDFHPKVKKLTLYLRYLLTKTQLHGPEKISTSVLFWLVVYFMQRFQFLPPASDIKEISGEYFISERTSTLLKRSLNETSLSELYLNFATFYVNFEFAKYVISPYYGYSFPIEEFEEWAGFDQAHYLRLSKLGDFTKRIFFRNVLNLQDVTILNYNIAEFLSADIINIFKSLCNRIYYKYICHRNMGNPCNAVYHKLHKKFVFWRFNDLMQFFAINLDVSDETLNIKNLKQQVIRAIRIVMEFIFCCEVIKIEKRSALQVSQYDHNTITIDTIPVIYLNYHSTKEALSRNSDKGYLQKWFNRITFPTYFICEIYSDKKIVKISAQSDIHLIRFMIFHLEKLLLYILKRLGSVVE